MERETFIIEFGGTEQTGTGERINYQGDWPPPETMKFLGEEYQRVTYSKLAPGLFIRGAKYRLTSKAV